VFTERTSAEDAVQSPNGAGPVESLRRHAESATAPRLMLRDGRRTWFVRIHDIGWIESDRNHVIVHTSGARNRVRGSIKDAERRLGSVFARVHRGALVNLEHIVAVRSTSHGDFEITLHDGTLVKGSRKFRERLSRLYAGASLTISAG
jgi:two-component system LytT family response regulator